jgi:hypothetical protein
VLGPLGTGSSSSLAKSLELSLANMAVELAIKESGGSSCTVNLKTHMLFVVIDLHPSTLSQ